MTRLGSVVGFVVLALCAVSCSVDDVDHEGKACTADAPCPGGYSCTGGACCTPRFSVSDFAVDWKTSNTVRISWTPPESDQDFLKYVVVIGKSAEELANAEQQARAGNDMGPGGPVRAADDIPELGQYQLQQSEGFDPVEVTSIDLLEPATEYRVKLLSFDSSGCAASTPAIAVRTDQNAAFEYVIFDDVAHPGGTPRPDPPVTFATDASLAFEGEAYIDWPGTSGVTYELVGLQGLNADMETFFPSLDFTTAFVEAAVELEGNPLAVWGEVRVLLGPTSGGCTGTDAFGLSPYALRPGGGYHVIQIPLADMVFQGQALTPEDLATRELCEVSLGQTFASGQGMRIDAVRLRW